jgi:hypothetical protein
MNNFFLKSKTRWKAIGWSGHVSGKEPGNKKTIPKAIRNGWPLPEQRKNTAKPGNEKGS